jgi:NOL1/NOP2/sun family putative RNA methylase
MTALPRGFINQLKPLLGSGLPDFIDCFTRQAHRGIRFSARREPPDVPDLLSPIPWEAGAFYLADEATAGSHPLHDAGAYYIQEPSAMAAVSALDPLPGDRVLDLCAAPGGKASQIGNRLKGQGVLVANEISPARARILVRNMERMGITNAAVTCESPARLAERLPRAFDKILVDAPCSGEGMFRREPESREQWKPESLIGCALRQREILRSAACMLRPGGLMVYSTCTFNETENEGVIESFLREHPDFRLMPFSLPGLPDASQGMLRIWPHLHRGEGHFIALLAKEGDAIITPSKPLNDLQDVNALIDEWAKAPVAANLLHGSTVYHKAPALPDLSGLRLLSPGPALAQRQGRLWKPAHALALISQPRQTVVLNEKEARRFQQGHPLSVPAALSGWTTPTLAGWPLSWGKATDGTLKNHYPKGLRKPL